MSAARTPSFAALSTAIVAVVCAQALLLAGRLSPANAYTYSGAAATSPLFFGHRCLPPAAVATARRRRRQRAPVALSVASDPPESPPPSSSASASKLKIDLIQKLTRLRTLQERDGYASIDFGVKGGELNATTRAPQTVNYRAISDDVGDAADDVLQACDDLSRINPTVERTKYLGDPINGDRAPLHGTWKLLFTTAADASFSKNSTRGDAKARNVVDAKRGRITNVIDFATRDDGSEPALKQLNVVIKATPAGPKRVALNFLYAKAVLTKFFFFPLFGRKLTLYIPVPAAFITRIIVFFSRLFRFGRGGAKKVPPKAFFDVLYLDDDLRIHRTGESNLFVQARESWELARPLLA